MQNHPGHDVRFEVDATVALSSAREAYAPKKSHGGIEPVSTISIELNRYCSIPYACMVLYLVEFRIIK